MDAWVLRTMLGEERVKARTEKFKSYKREIARAPLKESVGEIIIV